ncbi:DUF6325 family protein [Streptomyces sp. cg35]|uniref:DUF6325 family protein n=1 Tax=Streptomyces sp. cg35 TaxID=3421650 RepID=UPI003D16A475
MDIGPLDYMVIEYPGAQLPHGVAEELKRLASTGAARIVDLAFVRRDPDGTIELHELSAAHPEVAATLADLDGDVTGLLSDEDLELISEEISAGTTAAVLVWENIWVARTADAIRRAGATVTAHERVPDSVTEADLQFIV